MEFVSPRIFIGFYYCSSRRKSPRPPFAEASGGRPRNSNRRKCGGFNFMFGAKFGFDTSQRSCQVRQAVDFASVSTAKSSRLPRRHEVSRESFRFAFLLLCIEEDFAPS